MKAGGANMGMSLKQPLIFLALMTLTLAGFQNCAKVGVEDLGSSDPVAMGAALDLPPDENDAGNLPDSDDSGPGDVVTSNPPIIPPVITQNPPTPPKTPGTGTPSPDKDCDDRDKPPVVKEECRPMNQVRIKDSKGSSDDSKQKHKASHKHEMQTVACLIDPGQSCVLICHRPPGNPSNSHTKLMKSSGSIQAHLAHGDTLGACAETPGARPSDVIVCEEIDEDKHGHDYENPHDPKTKI